MDQIKMYSNYKQLFGLLPSMLIRRRENEELSGLLKTHELRMRATSAVGTDIGCSTAGYESDALKLIHAQLEQHDAKQRMYLVNMFTMTGKPAAIDNVIKSLHQFYADRGYQPSPAMLVL